jgi:hypothetical protein
MAVNFQFMLRRTTHDQILLIGRSPLSESNLVERLLADRNTVHGSKQRIKVDDSMTIRGNHVICRRSKIPNHTNGGNGSPTDRRQ